MHVSILLFSKMHQVDEDKQLGEAVDSSTAQAIKEELAAQKAANAEKSALEEEAIAKIVQQREEDLQARLAAEAEACRVAVTIFIFYFIYKA